MMLQKRVIWSLPQRLCGLVAFIICAVIVSFHPAVSAANPETRKLIVVFYPEGTDGSPGTIGADRGIRETFAANSHDYVEIRNEYVDTNQPRDPEVKRLQREYLRRKYADRKVDLVIAVLSSALDFALSQRAEILPGVPIVYCAVDQRELSDRKLPPDVIGGSMRVDFTGTLELALRLHPGTRQVYVVGGSAPFDILWEAEARRMFRLYEDRLEFVYLTRLPMDYVLDRVANLPQKSIIYYLHVFQDGTGKGFVPAEVLGILSRRANAPIYGHSDVYAGGGAVGGRMISLENEGRNAARLGSRILAGEKPETITVPDVTSNSDVFDWRQLQRWGIDEKSLPDDSVVRYKERTFWEEYKWHMLGVLSLCVVEAILIAVLLIQFMKRRRADERFRQVVETASTAMLMVGSDGKIVIANPNAEQLFGYSKGELLGQTVELLVPMRSRDHHPIDRDKFFASPKVRQMGLGRDLFGRRKDGSELPVEIGLSPLHTQRGLFVLASIIDLTERRRAEEGLRTSQRELKLLTGRLLESQEAELRRIARELHDDLNQNLALLAVEMEVLAGSTPESPAQITDYLRELCTRVKELSSTVHDLSHQLHPTKLEQLGLVVAVRGLCNELSQQHGFEVEFTHSPELGLIPHDEALCLYRIVQEALQNIIKHSGSRHASVELSSVANTINLRITDDGIGFDTSSVEDGLGLVSMRERLYLVGGKIVIDSRPSGGTRIEVCIPFTGSADTVHGVSDSHPRVAGRAADELITERTL